MLTEREAYATIPAADLDRAIQWYEAKLGLKPKQRIEGGVMYKTGTHSHFVIYPTVNAGKGPQTVMAFSSPDVEVEVRNLKARGVVFEEYDFPGLKTVNSIAKMGSSRGAWFRDSEGNILGVFEMPA